MDDDRRPTLDELLVRQLGLVSRAQLLDAGISPDTIRWRVRRGLWQRVLPALYATFSGRLDTDQRLVAAVLHGGPGSQITGGAALRWHGFRYAPSAEKVDLLVAHSVRRNSAGFVVIRRTTRLDPRSRRRSGFEVCSVPRAVADAARRSSDLAEVRAWVAESVQRRLATVADLLTELDDGPAHGSALFRTAVAEIADGARSAPEAELRSVVARSDVLPAVLWNPRLVTAAGVRLPTPDGWIAEVGIALEVDSKEYHLTPDGWARTMRRHNVLAELGGLVLHFTPAQIQKEPAAVLKTVEAAYLERRQTLGSFTAIRVESRP